MSSNPGQSYKGISRCILGQKSEFYQACSSPINIINNFMNKIKISLSTTSCGATLNFFIKEISEQSGSTRVSVFTEMTM